jgi:hypothetical protein
MQLAIVSRTGNVLDAYKHFFQSHDVELIHAVSISELYKKLYDTVVSGVIVDLQTVMKASDTEKIWLAVIEGIFLSIRANWNPEAGFRILYRNVSKSSEENQIAFIEDCRNFKPRTLRKDNRQEIHFNVLFWSMQETDKEAQRAYTLNVSPGGLFVCACYPSPQGSSVWVQLQELDPQPIKVLVTRSLAWGEVMRIPGFGGSFSGLEPAVIVKLEKALKP